MTGEHAAKGDRMRHHRVPGVLVVSCQDAAAAPDLRALLVAEDLPGLSVAQLGRIWLATWGAVHEDEKLTPSRPLLLSNTNWGDSGPATPADVARWLNEGALTRLGALLPPFGVVGVANDGVWAVADGMGFKQIFLATGDGWSAFSTSARLLARLDGLEFDTEAVLLQSQLGWQLGQRTFFQGVTKLAPGEAVRLKDGVGHVRSMPEDEPEPGSIPLSDGVRRAANLLRNFLEQYLDEVPDPTLQLTGGQDSRLLLSAIPRTRRKGLKVMTLDAPGTRDAEVAGALAARYGMVHTVRTMSGVSSLRPQDWFSRVWEQAKLHDCMADPIAHAGTAWVEESFEQGHRLSGLGGELGRGFYYTGWVRPRPVTRSRSEQLARWRMFANEPVEPRALAAAHRDRALSLSLESAYEALDAAGPEWYHATDELYYRHRMQRWAGLGESVASLDRTLTNPMLDYRFRFIVRGLAPRDKHRSRFLGQLQLALDEELATIPLDDRPPPVAYAHPGPISLARQHWASLDKLARKARQRLEGSRRPPPGGAVITGRVTDYLRTRPETLDPARDLEVFDEQWLNGLASGTVQPAPSSLALLINTLVAASAASGQENPS